ncbi:AEC family transporter [Thermococcus argininiproducens]|uniref:AEC family transporter n=1 Tax=Thermococcus argininiproducens TaxID=2866384 RepID=A0A9E7SCD9_9EURY|nr:AEC family transporter [Thermococcus argininiproducens]USG99291.1 AEC family transporter [Thermococcus argininiproducens]
MNIYEMLGLIVIGFILKRVIKSEKLFVYLNKIAIQLLLTFYIFSSVAAKNLEYLIRIKLVFVYVFLIISINLMSSYFYARFFVRDNKWKGALIILSTYPNTVAMGFPIASLFLDDLTPVVLYASIHTLVIIPLATFLAAHYSSGKASLKESLLRALKFPPTSANLLALGFVFLDIKLPTTILTLMNQVGWWSIPIILIYFGSRVNLQKFELRKLLEVSMFRTVIPFLFVFLTLKAPSEIFYAVLVEATMPPAIIANAILAHYGLREEEGIGVTIVLTLIVLTLFLVLRLLV